MVDALRSGRSGSNPVEVQILFRPPINFIMEEKRPKVGLIKKVFWSLTGIFILLSVSFFVFNSYDIRMFLPITIILVILFFLLGGILCFLVWKSKIKGALRKFLFLTGASALGFLLSVFLHNAFYALGIITNNFSQVFSFIGILHYIMDVLHVIFFLMAIPICPILFLFGITVSIIFFLKNK